MENPSLTHNDFTQIWKLYEIIFGEPPKHRKSFYTLYSWHGENLFKALFRLIDQKLSGKLQYKKVKEMTNQEFTLIDTTCRQMNDNNNTVLTYRLCGDNGYRVSHK
jgi:hypothetical protein